MSNKYLWYIIIILAVLLVGGAGFWWYTSQDDTKTTETEDVVDITDTTEEETEEDTIAEEEEEEEEEEDTTVEEEEEDTSDTVDLTNFSQNNQTVGSAGAKNYDLTSISNSSMGDYHRITFNVKGTSTSSTPYVTAQYKSELSSIRVVVNGLKTDTSGIAFQDSVSINKDGVTQIYHNISGVEGVAHYDIGVSKAANFYLHYEKTSSTEWKVYLDVEYPGATSGSIDLGSTTFTKTKQSITGGTSADGAGINTIYWNNKTLTIEVTGSTEKPLPNCYAEYQGGKLKLVFTDLAYNVFGSPKDFGSIGGLGRVTMVKSGNTSTFTFEDISSSNFKLSGTLGPNQIMLEVQ